MREGQFRLMTESFLLAPGSKPRQFNLMQEGAEKGTTIATSQPWLALHPGNTQSCSRSEERLTGSRVGGQFAPSSDRWVERRGRGPLGGVGQPRWLVAPTSLTMSRSTGGAGRLPGGRGRLALLWPIVQQTFALPPQ